MGNVTINLLDKSHVEDLLDFIQRNKNFLTPYQPRYSEAYFTKRAVQDFIDKPILGQKEGSKFSFGIFLDGNKLIGQVNLSNIIKGAFLSCNIGYAIDEFYQGKGYMTEAVRKAVKFAFDNVGLHRVEAGIMPYNKGSIRVVEKVGFELIGLSKKHIKINGKWEDHVLYAILNEGIS